MLKYTGISLLLTDMRVPLVIKNTPDTDLTMPVVSFRLKYAMSNDALHYRSVASYTNCRRNRSI